MSKIDWDDSFNINNAEIDNQHKKWIEIYNDMHDKMSDESSNEFDSIAINALTKMLDYVRYHFKTEEAYMDRIDYPDIVEHVRKHKDFDTRIYQMNRDLQAGKIILNTEILSIIKDWLIDHILSDDIKLGLYAAAKRMPQPAVTSFLTPGYDG